MTVLRLVLALILITTSSSAITAVPNVSVDRWQALPGYTLHSLLHSASGVASIVGTSGLSLPDGRQALITMLEIRRGEHRWVYRCIDYFDSVMRRPGQGCYELRQDDG